MQIERLANGYIRVQSRSGLSGLYHPDERYHCGDLRQCGWLVARWVKNGN